MAVWLRTGEQKEETQRASGAIGSSLAAILGIS